LKVFGGEALDDIIELLAVPGLPTPQNNVSKSISVLGNTPQVQQGTKVQITCQSFMSAGATVKAVSARFFAVQVTP
jgi:hypothetical protein